MNISRVLNLQAEVHQNFPKLENAYSVAIAQRAVDVLDNTIDPFPGLLAAVETFVPKGIATPWDCAMLALLLAEADEQWMTIHPEANQ